MMNFCLEQYMSNTHWNNSKCKGSWLHRFVIGRQWNNGIEEICQICGKRKVFKEYDGRINNNEYISFHIRQMLIPQHRLFQHEYGSQRDI